MEDAGSVLDKEQAMASIMESISVMTFSKKALTGVYLACNQAFAEYAHKASPADVLGLTAADLFDAESVIHFDEYDRRALSMNRPFVCYEYARDADGIMHQFQTTRVKYVDGTGQLCLQCVSQDVSEQFRIRQENAEAKKAYEISQNKVRIYTHLAHALARGYSELYYVNMDTDEFIEFHTDDERGVLNEARLGTDFFEGCERDVKLFVHEEDQAAFVQAMNRQFLEEALDGNKFFELTYRRLKGDVPFYVQMKVSRMEDDKRYIVIAISDVDELMRQRRAEEQIKEERIIYARLHALTGNVICVYVVDPETNSYREFSATDDYVENFAQAKEGKDFFETVREVASLYNYPHDLKRFLSAFTKENIMAKIEQNGIFTLTYRLMMEDSPVYVLMKATLAEEQEGLRLIVGLYNVDVQVKQEKEYEKRLAKAEIEASVDAMTGVKNKHAYLETETRMDRQITEHSQQPFAVVIFDVNDLKRSMTWRGIRRETSISGMPARSSVKSSSTALFSALAEMNLR